MSKRRFILNADDFGMGTAFNQAVLEGYECGLLKSTSLVANGDAFESAVSEIVPKCPDLGVGVHLNIIEGRPLTEGLTKLTDSKGNFNSSYSKLILQGYTDEDFIKQVEQEFRAQIEKIKNAGISITHIDSHVHTHAIPPLFELTCKLAKEYGIKQIRTQFEKPYFIPDVFTYTNKKYYINLIKIALLDFFTVINKQTVERYELHTNNYLIGVGYTSMMNSLTVSCGLAVLKNRTKLTAEALIHPCRYEDGKIDGHFTEFQITKNKKLKEKIEGLGFEISNYREE